MPGVGVGCSHNKNLIYVTGLVVKQNLATEQLLYAFPLVAQYKGSPANAGDTGSIPGSRRSPGGGNGNPPILLPGKSHRQRSPGRLQSMGSQRINTTEVTEYAHTVTTAMSTCYAQHNGRHLP